MTIQTIRPNGVSQAGPFTAVGAASLNAATSDNSDASYAQSAVVNNSMSLTLGSYTLLANERVKLTRMRARASASAGASSFSALHSTHNLFWGSAFNSPVTTTITTYTSSWMTPPQDVTQALIDDLRMSIQAQYVEGGNQLRVQELYLDLDVRARPVINSFSASVVDGTATFSLSFTYNTSAIEESVTVRVDIYDDSGVLVDSTSQLVTGTDFSTEPVTVDYTSAFGTYTAVATVLASGFVGPNTTFNSATAEDVYTVVAAGVEPPILTCTTDQAAQAVTLEICQADNILPPSTDCLRIESFGTGPFGNQMSLPAAGTPSISTPDAVSLDLTGDFTIRLWAQATDWSPTSTQTLVAKSNGVATDGGYMLQVLTSGLLQLTISTGAAARTMVSTATSFVDGQGYWIEVFYDNTAKTARFRKSSDGLLSAVGNISWTTINTTAAHAGGSPSANALALRLGALSNNTGTFRGAIGFFDLLSSSPTIGTMVARADFRSRPTGTTAFSDPSFAHVWTFTGGATVIVNSATVTTVGAPRHVALWINDTLTTADFVFGANSVTIAGDTQGVTIVLSQPPTIVVGTTGGGASNVNLQAYQRTEPGSVVHNLGTRDLIVQARVAATRLQAEIGVEIVDANTIDFTGPFTDAISILILAPSASPECVPTLTESVIADTDDQVFVHQFSSLLTMTTFVRTSDSRVSWVGVELNAGSIEVDNDGGAGTIYISGFLAVFDDPDAVRAEVRRDGELIPLDGLNGALIPPFGEGCLSVVDRFPPRFAEPVCEGDTEPVGPIYEVRFYGYVDGVEAFSPWAMCTPPAVIHNGQALLRDPVDEALDISGCVSTENFQRVRPWGAQQPASGGLPVVRINDTGGRDYSIVLEAPDTESALAIDALFQGTYIWYSPLDAGLPSLWATLGATTPFGGYKNDARPWSISQALTETEPEPVVLPPFGPPSS